MHMFLKEAEIHKLLKHYQNNKEKTVATLECLL